MNKDVIYIDVEDDITAIIGKVKASKNKVVALVPPKRIGVLQSAVNLRLLARTAKQSEKHLALVTSNHSLIALASAAAIPVAKNLQSKPELAEVEPVIDDDDEDIIEGAALPVGEHARQNDDSAQSERRSAQMAAALAEAPKGSDSPKKPKVKSGPKVPSFDKFRKKLVFIIVGLVLLIGFLVWAIFIAPRATVTISAKTTSSSINLPVTLSTTATTSQSANTIKAALQQKQESKSQPFTATGQKDAGSKATGTVSFATRDTEDIGKTIPAGTSLTSTSGKVFTTDQSVTITFENRRGVTTTVTAAENGSSYNAASGSLSGAPGSITASFSAPTAGGVSKTVTIVTAEDVQKAKQALVDGNTDAIKNELKAKFPKNSVVIDQSFAVDYGDVKTSPAVGEEASQSTLTTTITYKLYGVAKSELGSFIDGYLKEQIKGKTDQRVYENGSDTAVLQEASAAENGAKATLIATAQIGPKIDDNAVKNIAKGKRYGEIQEALEGIQGVDSVDVKFFPFWVSSVPNSDDRVTIDFNLKKQ
jgi:hypothetical protein